MDYIESKLTILWKNKLFMANYLNNKPEDKIIEKERYDDRALSIIKNDMLESSVVGSKLIPLPLRSPYLFYEEICPH